MPRVSSATATPGEHVLALASGLARRRPAVAIACLSLIVAIAAVDLATGYEFALSLLYLAPILAGTWVFGVRAGLLLSIISTVAWLATDILADHRFSHEFYRYWEALIKLGTFALFTLMLGELQRALDRSDERLIKVLEGLDAAVCVLDLQSDAILFRNRRFEAMWSGWPPPEDAAGVHRLLLPTSGAGSAAPGDVELRLVDRWFLIRQRGLRWTDGRPVVLVTATDVTSRRLAEEASRTQQERLQVTARLAAVGEIASSIAHELNQPLAAIANYVSGSLRRLRAGRADQEQIVKALEQAGLQTERAGEIIRRVRNFVRTRESSFDAVDLNELVTRASQLLAPEAARQGATITVDLPEGLPPVKADRVMIEQVVINLLRNAIEAIRDTDARALPIRLATGSEGDAAVRISVSDRGPGIAADVSERIFEPFFTTKPEGMGLGLNICRSIVELHGGRLWAAPNPQGGATLCFTLQRASK